MSLSMPYRVYWGMILVLAIVAALMAFNPQQASLGVQGELPAPPPIMALASFGIALVVYGGLGFLGLHLSTKLGFAGIWDERVSHRDRFFAPALAGGVFGVAFILVDQVFAGVHGLGAIPHPPFPSSVGASLAAGIGEEVIFRLFFISFWTWLICRVVLRGRALDTVFGVVTALSAIVFAVAHVPAAMFVMDLERVSDIPPSFMVELFLLNGMLSVVAALMMRKSGILAAVSVHFWTDVVWHVAWGAFGAITSG